jgi:uncharacterized membrane protein YdjX (TVP38/TMEM64 family)
MSRITDFIVKGIRILAPFFIIAFCLVAFAIEIRRRNPDHASIFPTKDEVLDYFKNLAHHRGRHTANDKWVYFGVVLLATISCLPVSPFEIAAGYIFSWEAMIIALPAKIIGSILSFIIGRIFWAELIRDALVRRDFFQGLQSAFVHNEWKFMFLIRIMYLPQWAKNYGLSVLNVRIFTFTVATTVVSAVFSVLFTYIGRTSEDIFEEIQDGGVLSVAVLFIGLSFAVFTLIYISAAVKNEISVLHAHRRLIPTNS